ncbi:MAG: SdiA-regulated domain-containing protein [Ferruginibacter sp.]
MSSFRTPIAFCLTYIIFCFFSSCNGIGKKKKFADSDMYNFSRPTVIKLPTDVDEISGIAYYPKDTSVFAIVDEDGMLFKIPIMNPNALKEWRFDKRRDYEDIVLIDSTFYILVSNGDIVTVKFNHDSISTTKANFSDQSKKVNEFESLYLDPDSDKLVMICKECEEDTKKSFSSFSYDYKQPANGYMPFVTADAVPIARSIGQDKFHVKASAAAVNPVTEDLYIISAVNKMIVITSKKGEFKKVYKLDPGIYKQPEGIAFTPQGDMIISNEFADNGFPELLILKNKLKGR